MGGGKILMSNSRRAGHRFHPYDHELINYFLRNKMIGNNSAVEDIADVDICKFEPWDLPRKSVIKSHDQEWFFFTELHWNGRRPNRATRDGYWKKTGRDRKIKVPGSKNSIGTKTTLVFYRGRGSNGERTNWVMHEHRSLLNIPDVQKEFVLYRLMKKPDGDNDVLPCDEVSEESNSVTPTYKNPATESITPEAQGIEKAPFCSIVKPVDRDSSIFQSTLPSQNSHMDLQSVGGYNNDRTEVKSPCGAYQQEDYYADDWNSVDWDAFFSKETTDSSLNTFDQPGLVTMDCDPQGFGFGSATEAEAAKPQDIDVSAYDGIRSSCVVSDSGILAAVNASLESTLPSQNSPMELQSAGGYKNDCSEMKSPRGAYQQEDYDADSWNSVDWDEIFSKETTDTSLNTIDQPGLVTMGCHPQGSGFGSAAEAAKPQDIDESAYDGVQRSCVVSDFGNLAAGNASLEAQENGKACFPPAVNPLDIDSHAIQSPSCQHHSLMDFSSDNGSNNDFIGVQSSYGASEVEDDLHVYLRSILESSELSYKPTINTLSNFNEPELARIISDPCRFGSSSDALN